MDGQLALQRLMPSGMVNDEPPHDPVSPHSESHTKSITDLFHFVMSRCLAVLERFGSCCRCSLVMERISFCCKFRCLSLRCQPLWANLTFWRW